MTTIRSCAARLIELLDKVGDDVLAEEDAINQVMQELLALPGLDTMVATPARNASDSGLGSPPGLAAAGSLRSPNTSGAGTCQPRASRGSVPFWRRSSSSRAA